MPGGVFLRSAPGAAGTTAAALRGQSEAQVPVEAREVDGMATGPRRGQAWRKSWPAFLDEGILGSKIKTPSTFFVAIPK